MAAPSSRRRPATWSDAKSALLGSPDSWESPVCEDFAAALGQKLRTRDNALHQTIEPIIITHELRSHFLNSRVVGRHQAATQCISQKLSTEVLQEIILP